MDKEWRLLLVLNLTKRTINENKRQKLKILRKYQPNLLTLC